MLRGAYSTNPLLKLMVIERFPPLSHADETGLLAIGGDLEPESLVLAYSNGIFPWPFDEETLAWFSPPMRAILVLRELHISRRLGESLRKRRFHYKMNTRCADVIRACAESKNRGDQVGTWITEEMIEAYSRLHTLGMCHSFEAYAGERLVGGVYGVRINRFFAAESSFYLESNASKGALCFMAEQLQQSGIEWVDCQVLSPFSKSFGAKEIPRSTFVTMLKRSLAGGIVAMVVVCMVGARAHAEPVWRCGEVFSSTFHEGCKELTTGAAKGVSGERVFTKSRGDKDVDANSPTAAIPAPKKDDSSAEDPLKSGTLFETYDDRPLAGSSGSGAPAKAVDAQDTATKNALPFIQCISEAFKGNVKEAAKCGLPNLDFSEINEALR
jgi:leucyl/phenylalanyl-tRNA--protein transferase